MESSVQAPKLLTEPSHTWRTARPPSGTCIQVFEIVPIGLGGGRESVYGDVAGARSALR